MKEYRITEGILKKYYGSSSTVTIPNCVTEIGAEAFSGKTGITAVTIHDGVGLIGENAFKGCVNLQTVRLPAKLTTLSSGVFRYCTSLKRITLPDGLKKISEYAFQGSGLVEITIPDGVETIGHSAFSNCAGLTGIALPDSVTSCDSGAFGSCASLEEASLSGKMKLISVNLFVYCKSLKRVNIPYGIETLCANSFEHCESLSEITLPDSVSRVFSHAFSSCTSLETVRLPAGLVCAKNAFDNCPAEIKLAWQIDDFALKVKAAIRWISGDMRDQYDEATVTGFIRGSRTKILKTIVNSYSADVFSKFIELLSGTVFDLDVIDECIEISKGNPEMTAALLDYKQKHFSEKKIERREAAKLDKALSFKKPSASEELKLAREKFSVSERADGLFVGRYKGQEDEWIVPEYIGNKKVVGISGQSSYRSGSKHLRRAVIPETVRVIEKYAFIRCYNLSEVVIPSGIEFIGSGAFQDCFRLNYKEVDGGLYLGNDKEPCVVLMGIKDKSAKKIKINESTRIIYNNAFAECRELTEITVPDSVVYINRGAFESCSNLKKVTLPKRLPEIEDALFSSCTSLAEVVIPETVGTIGRFAFDGCSSLTRIKIPDRVTEIQVSTFNGCNNLTEVILPQGLKSIDRHSFTECAGLSGIVLPDGLTRICELAFYECSSLKRIHIPASVKKIGGLIFAACPSIQDFTVDENNEKYKSADGVLFDRDMNELIFCTYSGTTGYIVPDGVRKIATRAFYYCKGLERIYIPASVSEIYPDAFDRNIGTVVVTTKDSYAEHFARAVKLKVVYEW